MFLVLVYRVWSLDEQKQCKALPALNRRPNLEALFIGSFASCTDGWNPAVAMDGHG